METVLSVATRAVLDACARLGLDAEELLSAGGLTRAEVQGPDNRLPAPRVDALWRAAHARANDPLLALHAAEALPFGAYKVLDFVAASSATVGEALRRVATYFALVDPRASLVMSEGEPAELVMRARDTGVEPPAQAQEFTFAALVTRMRICAGAGAGTGMDPSAGAGVDAGTEGGGASWSPARVDFTFAAPRDTDEYQRVFQTEIQFGSPVARLILPRRALTAPISSANAMLLAVLEDHARRLLEELPRREGLAARVREAIAAELGDGEPGLSRVARRLAMSERTLQRRLQEEGRTLAGLVDEVRTAVAKAHLSDPGVAASEVAWLLGFSDQSAFTRAFRRWTGVTPGVWRARHKVPKDATTLPGSPSTLPGSPSGRMMPG